MNDPKFSVVIPTRERHETLPHAIRSVLGQEGCDDFELIVMDNASSPETAQAVAQFDDPRLHYVRGEDRLCMSDNWDRAMQAVRGQYVTYLGDDDALMPDCLKICDCLLESLEMKVVSWARNTIYWWPSTTVPWHRNRLYVNLTNEGYLLQGHDAVQHAFQTIDVNWLPQIYSSVVRRDVMDRIRGKTGRYFPHPNPDIFSGVANGYHTDSYVFLTRSLSVAGNSAKSTGTSACYASRGRKWIDTFWKELSPEMAKLFCHPDLLPERNGPGDALGATILHTKGLLFPDDESFQISKKGVLMAMIGRLSWDKGLYDHRLAGILEFGRLHGFGIDIEKLPKPRENDPDPIQGLVAPKTLAVNGDEAGLSNVYEATRLAWSMIAPASGLTIKSKTLCDDLRKVA